VIYKVMFDTVSPTWRAYGRAIFVVADDPDAARVLAETAAQREYPDSAIRIVAIGETTEAARAAFDDRKRREREWMQNNRNGIPNDRRSL
jgi:hypothetical protein